MRKFTQLYNMISREWTGNGSGMDRVKSRITPHLSLIAMLMMLVLGGWSSEVFAAWSGSGEAVKKVGSTYYVVYDTDEYELSKGKTNDHALSGPGAGLTFEAKRNRAGTGDLLVTQNSGTSKLYEGNPGRVTGYSWGVELVDFQNYGSYGVDVNTTKITFKNDASISTNTQKQIKNVKVTMAQYLNNPTKTDLDCGTADINSDATSGQVNVAWCNVPAMSYEITDDAEGLFSVSVDVNSEAGKYNTSRFTVTYKHTKAGTHTAKLKITDTFNDYSKTITLSGTTNKQQPTITWSSNESFFNVDDVLSATSAPGTTVTLSSTGNESYVGCIGNTATMLAATTGKITITAHVAENEIYAAKDFTKEITITNLEKQHISWDQDFSHLKTTDGTKTITLNATSDSGLPVIYELVGDKTGLSLMQSGSVWTLTYSASECKNTTIVAKQGGNSTYAPASSVSKTVKVIDPTKVCDTNETLVNSTVTLKDQSTTYNIDIPSTMTIQVSRTKTGFFDIYINGFKVEIYSGKNGTGEKLHESSYSAGDINNSKTISLSNLNIAAKSVKLISDASNGYNVNSVTYTKQKKCTISPASLSFETYPNTETSAKTFDVTYANYPISLECSNPKFTFSPAEFGDCDAYGTQTVSVTYTAGADEGGDLGYLYIKDNTGTTLKTCTLNVTISKVAQSITSHTIGTAYKTTDRIELSAVANSELTDFVYSATPAGIASFAGNVMTFSQSGTIAITATQPGSNVYAAASATVENVKVNKVTPTIATKPTVAEIKYKGSFANSQLSEGLATVTLRGVENTPVAGSFTWTSLNGTTVNDAQGSHDYSVTFTPTDGGMYNPTTFTQSVTISRADGSIEMNNGEVKVKIAGINDDLNECKIDLDDLVKTKVVDAVANRAGDVTYEVISANKANAAIDSENKFSATQAGSYTIRATQAQTDYYEEATDEFTVTVNKLTPTIVFDNTENPQIIYSGDVIEQPAYRQYNGKFVDRNVQYVSSDPSDQGAIYVGGSTLTARNVTAPEGSAVEVTITASTTEDALYNTAELTVTHNYAVRAKRSPVFTMEGVDNAPVSKTLNIGEQAIITYNEFTNEYLTVGTASEHAYVSYVHEPANRRVIVTAVKGTIVGDGVQEIIVNQPGNDYLFPRNITYTFTVKKNVSALSLDPLTTTMEVEDTVTSIYSGLANTAETVAFSCSPEGSMKYEDGKLIALQAGTNTVTFSQPATEYWTGISESKTITVSKKNPGISTQLGTRHAWYSIIEHPFKSLNTEKPFTITSSNKTLAEYIAAEDKIYVYGTSGNVTFTVNQDANYKYDAVADYQKTFTIFQPSNRLPMTLTSSNLEDYTGGSKGDISWNNGGVLCGGASGIGIGGAGWDWSAKYIVLSFVGIPDVLSFDFQNANSTATQYGWHFYQSSDNSNWIPLKEYEDLLMNATGGTSEGSERFKLNPDTRYVKLEYHGNFGGRFKNVSITERKEIAPKANTMDFGLGYNGNDPTTRTIKVDWYNVKPCTVTITGTDADKFVLGEGYNTIYSQLDHYGMAELSVSYKHETNSETTHTATLHIEDADGNYANITLNGQTTPAPQEIIWRSDLTPMPINGAFPDAAVVASNQPITLSSDNEGIVRVDANNTLVGVAAGTAHVTATAEGNTKWAETTSYIDIEVTTKNVQFITWNDNLSNRKREDGQTVEIELTATSTAGLPITYELDGDAQVFASISGNVLRLTGWGKGQVIAKQVGDEDYVAVQAVKSLVSRNPAAGCKPLVGEYTEEYTIWTLGEKEIELYGEPATIEFDAKCDASALYGLWVGEFYDDYYHEVAEIKRLEGNNLTSSYKHFGPFALNRNTTKVRIYTKTGATMNRTFKNVEVTLAKYLELADNQLHFEQVDKGSNKTQSFYINYSNLTGMLDVEMETASTQFEVLTTTVGEDCGDAGQNKEIQIRFTGNTVGTEENAIIVHNNDQSLRVPVSATVVLPSQTITWEPEVNVLTTDDVELSATATSELPVSFTSGNTDIADVKYEAGVYSLDIKSYGDVDITAHQAGNEDWSAATDKTITFHISRVVPTILANPTATGVVLPNTLAGSTLEGGSVEGGIAGTFRWQDATISVTKGVATYTAVFDPENDDWYETVPVEVAVPILKTPQTISWAREDVSEEGCSDIVILDATASSGLPITYHSSDSTKAYAIDAVINEVAVKKLYILKGGDVTITAVQPGDETYAPVSVSKTITLIRVLPTIETLPTATDMYVHHFLNNSTPQGGMVKAGANTVTGTFNWKDGSEVMDVPGTNQRTVVFHPYNSDFYQEVSAVINVEVQRFAPTVIHTFTTETSVYGSKLSEFTLNGSGKGYDYTDPAHYEIDGNFTWKDENQIPSVSDEYAIMVFHPTHTEWYDDVEIQVPITITKAAIVSASATATMFYGQVLGEAELTNTTQGIVNGTMGVVAGTVTWDSSLDMMEYYELGDHENLPIRFTPTDPNYESVEIAGMAVLTVEAGYVFDGTVNKTWDNDNNWRDHETPDNTNNEKVVILADVDITGLVSVDALTIKEGVTVTVKDGAVLTIGNSDSYIRSTYGNLHVENGGKVILGNGELKVNNFILDAQLGNISTASASGQVNGAEKLDVNGDAYFQLALDPSGRISYGWYDFVVPFEVDVIGGISVAEIPDMQMKFNVNYAVMDYTEAKRAVNGKYWNKFSGTLIPGRAYTITLDDDYNWNTVVFKKKKGSAVVGSNEFTTDYSGLGADNRDNGWNGFGNGTLHHTELDVDDETLIQMYDHSNKCYQSRLAKDQTIAVGVSFFMQVPEVQTINLEPAVGNSSFLAPSRDRRESDKFRLALTNEGAEQADDYLWVSADADATGEYVIGRDVLKMGTMNESKVARMWSERNGMNLCSNEMTLSNSTATCPLNIYAPNEGQYIISVEAAPENTMLYLTYNGRAIWNLTYSPYALDLTKGTTEGYGLKMYVQQVTTDIENDELLNGENAVRKVLIDDVIYIITPEGKMYDITGKGVNY